MKTIFQILIISVTVLACTSSFAGTTTSALGTCLVDNLNGKERKNLAKWIFLGMASHPEIMAYSKATSDDMESSDKFIGKLVTRLLVEDCPNELKAAYKVDPTAIEKAFGVVGEVAMKELMANQNVSSALNNYSQYTDFKKLNSLLSE